MTVSDTVLTLADPKGTVEGSYSYGGEYLREYDTAGDDFTVLLHQSLSVRQSGPAGHGGEKGEEIASLDISDRGGGIGRLRGGTSRCCTSIIWRCTIRTADLCTLEDTGYAGIF